MGEIAKKVWEKVEKVSETLNKIDGNIIGKTGYTCGVCNTLYDGWAARESTVTKGMDAMKCRKCKIFICPDCCKKEKSVENNVCPKCGGEIYFPLWP
ncbi:MAG: hypothetical protein KJ886_06445 [Candidatus Thermoplasmatota archaeon]|nr:hypothetical protein [Candidatus Thermoplasmatota archaeon]MCG2826333.1 hypothetical protein [Thermoplasmatales archaeon]